MKKSLEYKIASKFDICKITNNQQQPAVNILDLHVGHVGGEVQKNIYFIISIVGISRSGRATLSSNSREIGCKSRIGHQVCI